MCTHIVVVMVGYGNSDNYEILFLVPIQFN